LIDQLQQYYSSRLTVILFFVLTLVTSGSAYAFVTGNLDPNFNSVFATSSNSDGGKGGGSSDNDNGGSSSDSNKKSKSSSGDSGGGGGSSDNGGSSSSDGGGSGSSTSTSPSASEENTAPPSEITSPPLEENTVPPTQTQPTCPDGSLPDANGNCPSPAPEQNSVSTPPPQTNQQTCPDGAAPDANGVCPTTSEGASPTNTPQEQSTANMLTGGIQTAAPIKSPSPPPPPEPFQGCPGHVARNANGICPSPLSKDAPCDEGFHHDDASGKCVDNKIPLADGTCAGGYSLENIGGTNTCNGKDVGPCPGNVARDANGICFDLRPNVPCAQDFHRDASGKCVDNTIPVVEGFCTLGWHKVSTGGCAPNSIPLEDGTCYGGHLVVSSTKNGKTISNCYPNEFPISAGTCSRGWYFVAASNSCMPGVPVQSGGKCPQGYHKTLMNVKDKDNVCAPDTPTKTTTTPSQPNQQPTQTGGGPTGTGMQSTGGGTGTTPTTQTQSGNNNCGPAEHKEPILDKCVHNSYPYGLGKTGPCATGWHLTSGPISGTTACKPNDPNSVADKPPSQTGTCESGYHLVGSQLIRGSICTPDPITKTTTPMQTGGTTTTPTTGTNTNPTTPTTTPPTSTTTTKVIRGSSSGGGGGGGGGGTTATTTTVPPAQTTNTFLTYVNPINKITIKYPSTWTKTELVGNPSIPVMFNAPIATTTAATAGAKTNFVISITPGATNLDSFTLQQINGLIQSKAVKYAITDTNAKILTPPTSITSYREISYDGMKNNNGIQVPLKGAAILFVNGGIGYSLLYLAKQTEYAQNLPMVQQMINSFQIAAGGSTGGGPVQNVAAAGSSR
jgi:PsbP-like protein